MSEGDAGGSGFGDGPCADITARDAHSAEFAPFDQGVDAHDRHHPPAHISFDYVPESSAPLEGIGIPDLTALPAEGPNNMAARTKQPDLRARFAQTLAFWR